jgi:hypothetical protein
MEDIMSKLPPTRMPNFQQPKRGPSSMSTSGPMPHFSVTEEMIAARAYELFLARGAQPGRDLDDWYQAEHELKLGRQ